MKIGTVEITPETRKIVKRANRLQGFGSGNRGTPTGDGGDGGDGGHHDRDLFRHQSENDSSRKWRVGMFLLLFMASIFFALFTAAYLLVSSKALPNWKPFAFPPSFWLGAALIIASSVDYRIAQNAFCREEHRKAGRYFKTTLLLGSAFWAAQIFVLNELISKQIRFVDNPFGIFVFAGIAVSAVFMLGAITALAYLMRKKDASRGEVAERRASFQILGWYWNFTTVVWTALFSLFNFRG
jgi:heme/copper-type cytochrome/quinol oxidase subunit 3